MLPIMKNAIVYGAALAIIVGVGASFVDKLHTRARGPSIDFRGLSSTILTRGGPLSGKTVEEKRVLPAFGKVELKGAESATIAIGSGDSAAVVSADESILSYVETEVRDGTLVIGMKNGSPSRTGTVRIAVSAASLSEIVTSGSGDIEIVGTLGGDSVALRSDGSGNIRAAVDVEAADIRISGSGDIDLSGRAEVADIGIFGSGNVRADDLAGLKVSANVAGSGNVRVGIFSVVDANIAGSGDVVYGGPARVSSRILGSGKVRARD